MSLSLSSLFTIVLLFTSSLAAPVTLQGRSFKVHQRRNTLRNSRSGGDAMDRAYRKFGFPAPEANQLDITSGASGFLDDSFVDGNVDQTTEPTAAGTGAPASKVAATSQEGDSEFLSPVTIGGQTMNMDFDTGSSDLWIFNTQIPTSHTTGQARFDPSKSSTFKELPGASFQISYGDKSKAAGNVGTDTVNIGGASVTNQAIELATDVTDSFILDANSDGLLGLGFSSINTVQPEKQRTFFDNIQSTLAQPVFTANLRHAEVGAYEFGRIDKSKFKGDLAYTPVDSSHGFWEFASGSFAVGDGPVQTNRAGSPAIADTGTSLMLVDDNVAQAYWSQVQGSGVDPTLKGFVFPCDASLPDFHVAMGEKYMATIPGELMNFSAARGLPGSCFGGLQSNNGQNLQIYGDVMFKSQFVVFDGGNTAIGFAPHS